MDLIIVESPTKAKTLTKFLGSDYKIESSFGHVRDLPKSKIGIDIENDFEPEYVVPERCEKNLAKLQKIAKKAKNIILATDEDREGEAIAWHLVKALNADPDKTKRIVFHEITKDAILEALKNPKKLNMPLVDAQQARRILDRLVGYKMSPFLWKKVARGLSAGRVQSVAVRLVVEREEEIKKFKVDEYWTILADLKKGKEEFEANLNKIKGKTVKKLQIKNKKAAEKILKNLKGEDYVVEKITKKENKKNPLPPFTTSTLQQTANRFLGFSAKQTMTVAQQLYEGVDIKGEGHVGLITYMRTDSLNLSKKFLKDSKKHIDETIGKEYSLDTPRLFKTKSKGAQEAHEAIRPTEAEREPENLEKLLNNNQYKLYKLIWQRAMASQMTEAIVDSTTVDIKAGDYNFRSNGQIIKFKGYLKIYPEKSKELTLPDLEKDDKLKLKKLKDEQHFTKPPARYSDAGLVKILEQHGIGRPSTYAPTIATIITRKYVERDENKRLGPTDIAFIVNKLLTEHFEHIVDFEFTAEMEDDLDKVAENKKKWQPVIKDFYKPFIKNLKKKDKELTKKDIMPEEKSEEKCDKCGAVMLIKTGRYGKFLACGAYPDCKNIKSMPGTDKDGDGKDDNEEIKDLEKKHGGQDCEKCGSDMVVKVGRFGPFLACSGYPKCKNIKNITGEKQETGVTCPVCKKGEIVQKRSRRGAFYACNQYPDCKTAFWGKPTGKKCPDCGSLLLEGKKEGVKCSNKECGYEK